MATYTSYLNLEKPTTSETFNLLKMNANWDKIDNGVSALNSKLTASVVADLNSATDTGLYSYRSEGSNIPNTTAGNVLVIAGANVITQLAMSLDKVFVRRYANGSWNNWTER